MFPRIKNILLSIGRAVGIMKDITSVILFIGIIYAVIGLQVIKTFKNIRCGKDYY